MILFAISGSPPEAAAAIRAAAALASIFPPKTGQDQHDNQWWHKLSNFVSCLLFVKQDQIYGMEGAICAVIIDPLTQAFTAYGLLESTKFCELSLFL